MCTINIGSEQEELDMKRSHMRQTFMTAPKTNTTTSFFRQNVLQRRNHHRRRPFKTSKICPK